MKNPSLSVAICTRNRPFFIATLLKDLADQDNYIDELIVIENVNETKDFDENKVAHFFKDSKKPLSIKYISGKWPNIASSRNIALEIASKDLLVFIDDDIRVNSNFISIIKALHKQHKEAAIVGKTLPTKNDMFALFSTYYCFYGMHLSNKTASIPTAPFYSISFKRRVIKKRKLRFDNKLKTAEDIDFLFKYTNSGETLLFTPELKVKHDFGDFRSFLKRFREYGSDRFKLYKRYHKKYPTFYEDIEPFIPLRKLHLITLPFYLLNKIFHLSWRMYIGWNLPKKLLIPTFLCHTIYVWSLYHDQGFKKLFVRRLKSIIFR